MEKTVLTISGDLGSGKSTVSYLLADRLNLRRYSTGDVQRKLAADRGMTSLEFNRLAETEPDIDRLIDQGTADLANDHDRLVFDSRLAWHFVPVSTKIYLSVDPQVAAERVKASQRGSVETYETIEEAVRLLRERRASEVVRFQHYYGIQVDALQNFDLIVDTTHATPDEVADILIRHLDDERTGPTVYAHPKAIALPSEDQDPDGPAVVEFVPAEGRYYLRRGRASLIKALRENTVFLAASIA